MSPSFRTGEAVLFESVAVLYMVTSLTFPIAYFYQQHNFSF